MMHHVVNNSSSNFLKRYVNKEKRENERIKIKTWMRCSWASAKKNEIRELYKYHLHVYAIFFLFDNIDSANYRKDVLSGSPNIMKSSIHTHI